MKGVKYDKGKPRWSLLPAQAIRGIIEVLEHGSAKYEDNNWVRVPDPCNRYYNALQRHLDAMDQGETNDPDSGLPHAWHMCCSAIMFGWHYMNNGEARDAWVNRFPAAPPPEREPEPEQPKLPFNDHEHIWELAHTDSLKAWYCTCGASVHETANGRYQRRDSGDNVLSTHSTYFQATHVP